MRYLVVLHETGGSWRAREFSRDQRRPQYLAKDINWAYQMAECYLTEDKEWFVFNTSYLVEESDMDDATAQKMGLL